METELEATKIENERLRNELRAAHMALKKWLENVEELKEITEFLSK